METIDLRSDTVTLPTAAMRQAMAAAEVGDDVYGEDPSVLRLEAIAADLLGKPAALFVPSGTMGNLAAVLAHCQRGDEVILGDQAHTYLYEAGGIAALGGVHPRTVRTNPDGTLDPAEIEVVIRGDDAHFPITRLISLENTHNRTGGSVLSVAYTWQVAEIARQHSLALHIDGARIFNAAAALGVAVRELAEPADSITFCLSKALAAPVGSVLVGDAAFIRRAHRARKQLGGGMRQAGVLAAAGIVALETMVDRLGEDHRRARLLAAGLAGIAGVVPDKNPPPSNMVYIQLDPQLPLDAAGLAEQLEGRGIKVLPVAARRMRLVPHCWTTDAQIEQVISSFGALLG